MTSKIINTSKILVLCISIAFTVVPAVSASQGGAVTAGKDVNKATTQISYTILPAGECSPSNSGSVISALST